MNYLYTTDRYESFSDGSDRMARGLGWMSIGIGLAELFYGRRLSESMGMDGHGALMRGYGLREIGTGLALIMADDPKIPMWARVAGDALDLATLVPALDEDNPDRDRVKLALAAVAAITVVDLICTQALQARARYAPEPPDYSDRSGFSRPAEDMRGVARHELHAGPAASAPSAAGETGEEDLPEAPGAERGIPASPTPANQSADAERPLREGDGI